MKHNFEDIQDFEDLTNRLRNWKTFTNDYTYDFVGIMHLLEMCLLNLKENALEIELNDASDCLSKESLEILKLILGQNNL
jgi:hypothetical protein